MILELMINEIKTGQMTLEEVEPILNEEDYKIVKDATK